MGWEDILSSDDYDIYRRNISLLEEQVLNNFIHSFHAQHILSAIRKVPRHLFVSKTYKYMAYTDNAIPTSGELTTSAPSVIAEMIYASGIRRGEKLLEIGTGTGYQAAILCEMGIEVFTIEINRTLAKRANEVLVFLGYKIDKAIEDADKRKQMIVRYNKIRMSFPHRGSVRLFTGNGQYGLESHSPYKAIIISASVPHLNCVIHLINQLDERGSRMIVPIGGKNNQNLYIIERNGSRFSTTMLEGATFDFLRLYREES